MNIIKEWKDLKTHLIIFNREEVVENVSGNIPSLSHIKRGTKLSDFLSQEHYLAVEPIIKSFSYDYREPYITTGEFIDIKNECKEFPVVYGMLEEENNFYLIIMDSPPLNELLSERNSLRERWKKIFENPVHGVFIMKQGGIYVDVNEKGCEMVGYKREEILGKPFTMLLFDKDDEFLKGYTEKVKKGRKGIYIPVLRLKKKDGTPLWVSLTVIPFMEHGKRYYIGIKIDISKRVKIEEKLMKSEELYLKLMDHMPIGVLSCKKDGTITFVNKKLLQILGSPSEQSIKDINIFKIENLEKTGILTKFKECFEKNKYIYFETEYTSLWNKNLVLGIHLIPIVEMGNTQQVLTLVEDLTEKERTLKLLREKEEQMRLLLENLDVYLWQAKIDENGNFNYIIFTEGVKKITGYSAEDFIKGKIKWQELVHPADEDMAEQFDREVIEGKITSAEYRIISKDGEVKWVKDYAFPVVEGESVKIINGYTVDITNEKRLQNQLIQSQKMEAIGTLVSGIVHDFNNLMAAILGYVELLKMEATKEHRSNLLSNLKLIEDTVQKASSLTSQLLSFIRQEGTEEKPVDINRCVENVINILKNSIDRRISIALDLDKSIKETLGDPTRIEQVIMNLCLNAIQAMPHGGKLTIETKLIKTDEKFKVLHPSLKEDKYIKLTVSDTGKGIPENMVGRIFDPFFTTKKEGTGLGLSIVYGIVKAHRGEITVYSEVGKGTTFHVYLPMKEVRGERLKEPHKIERGEGTVLIVDDESNIRESLALILKNIGYEVFTAGDGKEALEIFEKNKDNIDLVLLDLNMPRMRGEECLMELKKIKPDIKIIVSTGFIINDKKREFLEKETHGILKKPYSITQLSKKIKDIIKK